MVKTANVTTATKATRTESGASGQFRLQKTAAIVFLLLGGGFHSWWQVRSTDQLMREQLLSRVRLMARAIDVSGIRALAGDEADLQNQQYSRLKNQFITLKQANDDLGFIYLMGRRPDGTVFFFLDNEPESSPDYVHPGQIYHDISPSFQQAMATWQECADGPIKDQWGVWFSALVMVRDPRTGEAVAGLAADIDAGAWNAKLIHAAIPGVLATLIMLAYILSFLRLGSYSLSHGDNKSPRALRNELLFVIGGGIILSLFIAWRVHEAEHVSRHEIFSRLAISEMELLADAMDSVHSVELAGLAGLFECSDEVTLDEFLRYGSPLTRNPLVRVWCYAIAVPDTEKTRVEERIRRQGFPRFRFWQFDADGKPEAARSRDNYFPVVYFAPVEGNEMIHGYDLGSESSRRHAIKEAMRTGLPTITEPTTGFNDWEEQKSIVICRPLLNADSEQRINGFVLAEIETSNLFGRDLRKYDTVNMTFSFLRTDAPAEQLARAGSEGRFCSRAIIQRPIFAFGKVFLLTASPGQTFMDEYPAYKGAMTLIAGLALTITVTIIVRLLQCRRLELERLVAERTVELRESELRFNQLAEHSRTVFWECDIRGIYTYVSPSSTDVYGYEPEELVGKKSVFDLWPETERERLHAEAMTIFEEKKAFVDFINPVETKTGEIILVESNGIAQFDHVGNIVGCRGFDHDATERERIVADLKNSRIEAEAANRAKSEFLTNMSHEIRTPISGIIGAAGLLQDTDLRAEQQEYAGIINASAGLLLSVVDELLDFVKISAGKIDLKQVDFDLRCMLKNLSDSLAMAAHRKGLELRCSISPEITTLLHGDESHLQQILLNLVGNAIKFTETGKIEIQVTPESETEATISLRFSIRDTGIGIAAEQQQKLYTPFFQADSSTSRRHGGTGLGLAITHHLVELMGGRMNFISEPDVGSEFFFSVTLQKQMNGIETDASSTTPSPGGAMPAAGTSVSPNRKVLVVEDNPINQRVLLAMLIKIGLTADVASNGVEALRALARENYLLVLMDIQMPVMDGLEAAEKIRDSRTPVLNHEIPIIAVTAHATSGYREKCLAVGMNDYLTKPVTLDQFRETLNRWLTGLKI